MTTPEVTPNTHRFTHKDLSDDGLYINDILDRLFAPPTPPIDIKQWPWPPNQTREEPVEDSRIKQQEDAENAKNRIASRDLNRLLYRLAVQVGMGDMNGKPLDVSVDEVLPLVMFQLREYERFLKGKEHLALDIVDALTYAESKSPEDQVATVKGVLSGWI